jgi:hypothetical protein
MLMALLMFVKWWKFTTKEKINYIINVYFKLLNHLHFFLHLHFFHFFPNKNCQVRKIQIKKHVGSRRGVGNLTI